jgi:hypothetical protein
MKTVRTIQNQTVVIEGDWETPDHESLPLATFDIQENVLLSYIDQDGDKIFDRVCIAISPEEAAAYMKELIADLTKVRAAYMKELGLKEVKSRRVKPK